MSGLCPDCDGTGKRSIGTNLHDRRAYRTIDCEDCEGTGLAPCDNCADAPRKQGLAFCAACACDDPDHQSLAPLLDAVREAIAVLERVNESLGKDINGVRDIKDQLVRSNLEIQIKKLREVSS